MDNNQNGNLPPGYSANDIVSNTGLSNTANQGLPPGYSPDDIVGNNTNGTNPTTGEIQAPDNADLASKVVHGAAGLAEGIGEGLFGTAAGAADILGGKGTGISDTLHHLAGDDILHHGTAQNVGRGVETIGEFLLGDEALKGLSFADKLKNTSSIMKYIEKSPRLARALQLGINVGKAGTELSPEERALLKQYPTLAHLAAVGLDSVRAGAVQAGQTFVRSGGNTAKAAKEGLGMTAGSALIGAPLAGLGSIISQGAEAANTAEGLRGIAETAPNNEQLSDQLGSTVRGVVEPEIGKAQSAIDEANEKLAGSQSIAEGLTEDAPTRNAITAKAQQAAQAAHDKLNSNYLTAAGNISKDLKGTEIPLKDSNIHQLAQGLVKDAEDSKDPLKDLFKIPNPMSPEATSLMKRITKLAEGEKEKEPATMSADDLMDFAKQVKENLRKTGFVDRVDRADRDTYFKMLDAIHNDFGNLADKAGKPEVRDALDTMNSEYKQGVAKFNNPDVKKILTGESEGNILRLLQGTGSVKDVRTIRDTIGKDAYTQLVDGSLQRMAADSVDPTTNQFDFNRFLKKYNSIDPEVRNEMIQGSSKGGPLELAMSQLKNVNASEVIPNSETTIKEAQGLMDDLIGNGNVDRLLKNPERLSALNTLVGPEAMGELGKSVMQNQLRQAATRLGANGVETGPIDFNKVMDFFSKFKDQPELVSTLFRPTPESAAAYDKALADIGNVQNAQKLVKLGLIAPAGLGVGALAGNILAHPFWGLMLAAYGEKFHGGELLNYIADHPATWRAIKSIDTVTKKPVAQGVNMLARYAGGRAATPITNALLGSAQRVLGGQ